MLVNKSSKKTVNKYKSKEYIKRTVSTRSVVLMDCINHALKEDDLSLAHRYSQSLFRLMRINKVRLKSLKFICKRCNQWLWNPKTCSIRKKKRFLIYTCSFCKYTRKHYVGYPDHKKRS